MKLTRPARRDEQEPVLPLVNIVFLLLIFFMISGVLAERPPFPVSPPALDAKAGQEEAGPLRLYVGANGKMSLGQEVLTKPALLARLSQAGTSRRIDIVADGGVAAQRVVALIREVKETGHGHIRLMTREGD